MTASRSLTPRAWSWGSRLIRNAPGQPELRRLGSACPPALRSPCRVWLLQTLVLVALITAGCSGPAKTTTPQENACAEARREALALDKLQSHLTLNRQAIVETKA